MGRLNRIEADILAVGYTFDLRTNELSSERVPNPSAGNEHKFVAYRLSGQASKLVSMSGIEPNLILDENPGSNEE